MIYAKRKTAAPLDGGCAIDYAPVEAPGGAPAKTARKTSELGVPAAVTRPGSHHECVVLTSVMNHDRAVALATSALAAALSTLEVGESLLLSTKVGMTACAPLPLSIEMIAVRHRRSPGQDMCGVPRLRLNEAIRPALPAYRFEGRRSASRPERHALAWNLRPVSDRQEPRAIGFAIGSDSEAPERKLELALRDQGAGHRDRGDGSSVPHTDVDAVLEALLASGIRVEVRQRFTAVDLSASSNGRPLDLAEWRRSPALECWCRDPRGYRIDCLVQAERPLPHSLLHAIGAVTFSTERIEVALLDTCRNRDAGDPAAGLHHRTALPPRLLASPPILLAAGIRRGYALASAALPRVGAWIGEAASHSHPVPIVLSPAERTRHCYVVGATGTGKSTLLLQMILDDLRTGTGLMLVDPHGDLFHTVLSSIPKSRSGDVVVLDAGDREHPFAFNLLAPGALPRDLAATFITNELLATLDALYDMRNCGGPIFETYFTHALGLLMKAAPVQPALADLPRVFEDGAFLRKLLDRCADPEIVRFWRNTALRASGEQSLANMTSYIVSKVNRLTLDASLRPILSQRSDGIDLARMMDQGRIVLVNLAKGELGGPSARLLGMAFVMRLRAATLARAGQQEHKRGAFHVYIDEFQNLATATVGTLLAEARKFGIGLTLASQTLGQINQFGSDLADIVTGNVGALIMGRLGPQDAQRLAAFVTPDLTAADLQGLPLYHAVAKFLARDVPPPPLVFSSVHRFRRRDGWLVRLNF